LAKAKKKSSKKAAKTAEIVEEYSDNKDLPKRQQKHGPDKRILTVKEIAIVEAYAGVGMTLQDTADRLGISKSTLERRMSDQAEVRDAIRRGRIIPKYNVSKVALDMAKGGEDPRMTRYWLNSRAGWQEKTPIQIQMNQLNQTNTIEVSPHEQFMKKLSGMSEEDLADFVARKTPKVDS